MAKTYPECDKMLAVKTKSQAIGEFLEWLIQERMPRVNLIVPHSREVDENDEEVYRDAEGKVVDGWTHRDQMSKREERTKRGIEQHLVPDPCGDIDMPLQTSTERLLAEFFGIDLDKVEQEKRQILEELQEKTA